MCSSQKRKTTSNYRRLALLFACCILCASEDFGQAPVPPSQYGRVSLDKYSSKAGLGPVVFDHWLHRAKFTCRLCHVDIGFAMQAQATGINARTNKEGFYCGACHDGKRMFGSESLFNSCSESTPSRQCARCHSADKSARRYDYDTFTAKLPRTPYGVDWEEAEATGLIKPIDTIEGLSIKKPPLKSQEDFSIQARVTWATDIIFSHKKHTIWGGCEGCHPDIFPAAKRGVTRYTMFDISGGKYCGACHGKVAFTTKSCGSCHKNMEDRESLKDSVLLPGPQRATGFGAVKFKHKTHVGEHNVKCEACHHPPKAGTLQETPDEACSKCHTRTPQPPVKTRLQAAFHNTEASAGVCIDCHKKENARNLSNDSEFVRSMITRHQATTDIARSQITYGRDAEMRQLAQEIIHEQEQEMDQMQRWLRDHDAAIWAPVQCRECHKRSNKAE